MRRKRVTNSWYNYRRLKYNFFIRKVKEGHDAKKAIHQLLKEFDMKAELRRIKKNRKYKVVTAIALKKRLEEENIVLESDVESNDTTVSSYDDLSDCDEEEEDVEEQRRDAERDLEEFDAIDAMMLESEKGLGLAEGVGEEGEGEVEGEGGEIE
jgi:hypothetical protein